MSTITFYHNPRCSKSRSALALLEARGCAVRIVEYLKTPPSAAELDALLVAHQLEPRALMRREEDEYAALQLDNPALTRNELVLAMVEHPRLIQRPIAVANGKAVIGRPPENVLELVAC